MLSMLLLRIGAGHVVKPALPCPNSAEASGSSAWLKSFAGRGMVGQLIRGLGWTGTSWTCSLWSSCMLGIAAVPLQCLCLC